MISTTSKQLPILSGENLNPEVLQEVSGVTESVYETIKKDLFGMAEKAARTRCEECPGAEHCSGQIGHVAVKNTTSVDGGSIGLYPDTSCVMNPIGVNSV